MTRGTSLAAWIGDHAVTADTLDPDGSLDELEPLREVVGDARVVAIGESAHHVREFYLLRHRLLRFLVERCGFSVYAFETPLLESRAMDAWIQGGPGTVDDVTAITGTGLARCQEMYRTLTWMRAHNHHAARPLRFAGVLAGTGGGSLTGELSEVATYLRHNDPDALPLLTQAIDVATTYPDVSIVKTLAAYSAMDAPTRDAMTASLSRLLSRMDSMGARQRDHGRAREHAAALAHLRRAWHLDHFTRDLTGHGLPLGTTSLDAAMAETVLRLLEEGDPDTRIVLGLHNVHIRRIPSTNDGPTGLFPAGYHLAEALGDDYLAIAATSGRGRTARGQLDPRQPTGFEFRDLPLPAPPEGSIETAFTTRAPLTIADLRAARTEVADADSFARLRMESYFADTPVFDSFDAIAHLPHTSTTAYITDQ
jgi:erythromycin esterase